jgi:asparagine synthase (glutamine-hydrolysing)
MCGIAGIISQNNINLELVRAEKIQQHRGPDASGCLQQQIGNWNIGLGHQRLSIIDLSEAGNQPMASADGQAWLVYNGEVYNYLEIRAEFEQAGFHFRSTSDTEVILQALQHWGPERALPKFNGMWAFAYLDKVKQRLILARDRLGVKPLYYFQSEGQLYFASEIKTILAMVGGRFSLNYQVIGRYLLQSLLETDNQTFFVGINKVPAAHLAEIDLTAASLALSFKPYWQLNLEEPPMGTGDDIQEEVRALFFDAVRLRLRSDVPLGILLSGGVDSSAIAVAMQEVLGPGANLNLLSAVSRDPRFDESQYIDIVARHLDQPVHKVMLDFQPSQAFDYLEKVCWFNDEPAYSFAVVSQYLLMEKAKDLGITVVLSGQGGDELLCGYKKYLGFYLQALMRQGQFSTAFKTFWSFWHQDTVLGQFSMQEAKRYLPSFLRPKELNIAGEKLTGFQSEMVGLSQNMTIPERQALDYQRFSIPILTHFEDRMSMAWARELREPFLDYRLLEKVIPLPPSLKLQHGWTKYIFRKAMEPYLPPEITWRKDKQGFVNPQSEWLKHELRPGVLKYFSEDSRMFKLGLVNYDNLQRKYRAYCQQPALKGNIWLIDIFNPLALEIWLRTFQDHILDS